MYIFMRSGRTDVHCIRWRVGGVMSLGGNGILGCSERATRNFCATCSHCTNGDTRGDKIHSVGALQERVVRSGTLVLSSWSALVRLQTMREPK
jgi:hypothetical protein